jgi:hypothetical protein
MSGTLDSFFSPRAKPKQVLAEERCSNPHCRKLLDAKESKYTLRIKGKEAVYCQACAKKILRPQEATEENL